MKIYDASLVKKQVNVGSASCTLSFPLDFTGVKIDNNEVCNFAVDENLDDCNDIMFVWTPESATSEILVDRFQLIP